MLPPRSKRLPEIGALELGKGRCYLIAARHNSYPADRLGTAFGAGGNQEKGKHS